MGATVRIAWKSLVVTCAALLSGCSGVSRLTSSQTAGNSVTGVALEGKAHGGQQPIASAHVYLYAATTAGYGGTSTSLLTSGTGRTQDGKGNYYVTTDSGGNFNISNEYTCPTAASQVYLYSIGGNPGAGTNSAAGLIAALGSCGNLTSSMYIVLNEVSTIASAYAMAGYATDATHVSNSGTGLANLGMANAFSTAANLETLNTGAALASTPSGDGIAPILEINTLANILAACINSTGPASGPCSTLFSNATGGSSAPTDTATAAVNIAHNPGANVSALYGLQVPGAPFQLALTAEPNDFTVAITYSGGGLDGTGFAPEGIAVDGYGNIWVPNYASSSISKLSPLGALLSGSGGFSAAGLDKPTSIAIDIYGNAWAANYNGNSLSEFNSSGTKISGPPGFTGSGLNNPYGIALDNVGHTWVADFGGNNLSEFTSSGTPLSGTNGFASGSIVGPAGIAADSNGNVWVADYTASTGSITEVNSSGTQTADPSGFTGGGLSAPYGLAIDAAGNVWASNQGGNGSISEFDSSGNPLSGSNGFTGGGITSPYGIAIDGNGNIWAANYGGNGNSISEFNSSGAPISGSNGYVSGGLLEPYGVAVDPSGNVWIASDNTSGPLTEFIGLASPVVTPLAAGVEYNQLGARP